jgi:hypothetical protein
LLVEPPTGFDWVIRRHTEVRAQRENDERHSGNSALHISFPALMRSEFQDVLQLIPVEAMKTYRLSYFVKTKYISAETPPLIEISDAMRPGNFALRLPAPGGTNDWREQTMTFTTPADTDGLRLTVRSPQLLTIDRTRIGEVWFDDFNLRKER